MDWAQNFNKTPYLIQLATIFTTISQYLMIWFNFPPMTSTKWRDGANLKTLWNVVYGPKFAATSIFMCVTCALRALLRTCNACFIVTRFSYPYQKCYKNMILCTCLFFNLRWDKISVLSRFKSSDNNKSKIDKNLTSLR